MKGRTIIYGVAVLAASGVLFFGFFCPHHLCLRTTCAKNAQVAGDMENIKMDARLYEVDTGTKPQSLNDLIANTRNLKGWRGPYLTNGIPLDPWGKPYSLTAEDVGKK